LPLFIYVLSLDGTISTNGIDASIMGTQYALWKLGSLSLGTPQNLLVNTVDYGVFNGRAFSAIAPGTALFSYPFAATSFALTAGSFVLPGPVQVADELFLAIAASVAVYFTYRICRFYAGPQTSLFVALAMAFGTPVWPFATIVFENAPSLMFSVISVYFVLRSRQNPSNLCLPIIAGLFLGLAFFAEYAAGLFAIPLVIFLRRGKYAWKRLAAFVLFFSTGLIAHTIYNFSLFGDPLVFPEQLKSGTAIPVSGLLSSFNFPSAPMHMLFYLVSPYRGIAFLCPILIAGLLALYTNLRLERLRSESLLFLSLVVLVLVFYSSWYDWAGGLAYGPRLLTLAVPYMLISLAPYLNNSHAKWERTLLSGLFIYSSLIQGAGTITSAFSVSGNPIMFQPLALNFPWLLQGKLDSWWISWNDLGGSIIPGIFITVMFSLIWAGALLLLSHQEHAEADNRSVPYVPYFDHFSEWNSVILSYVPLSWVQTGYAKYGGLTGYPTSQTYYREYNDGNGHNNLHFFSSRPSAGSSYGYTTTGYPPLWTWVCTDGAGETYTYWPGNPGVDAQAFAETTNTCIVIDGTHFNYLQHNNGNSWYLWDRYSAGGTTPYSVSIVSSSEFYASGGTGSC